MKSLALLPIAGALTLFGSAFSGVWTPPGLEGLPTYKDVLEQTPWGAPADEEPESGMFPISDAHQFRPHGVAGNWGDAPLIDLPERKVQSPAVENDARTAANTSAPPNRPTAPRRAVANATPKPPKVAAPRPSRSYQLAGSSTRFRR